MDQHDQAAQTHYPHGRGYGHDYMRGGEVFGGYGYADRPEYSTPIGELHGREHALNESGGHDGSDSETPSRQEEQPD